MEKTLKLYTQQVPPEELFPLITFIYFCYFSDALAFVSPAVLVRLLMSILFVLNLHMQYTVEVAHLCMYCVCVCVCVRVCVCVCVYA